MNSCNQDSRIGGCAIGGNMTWFDVITLATPKGGTGKSTLSRGLAAYWFALGRNPALVDADPSERSFRKPHCGSIRIDEIYIKIRGQWRYLYRAIDKHGVPVRVHASEIKG